MMNMITPAAVLALLIGGSVAGMMEVLPVSVAAAEAKGNGFSPYVDKDGNISRPTGFRESWEHLGTWFVPEGKDAKGPGFHDVYASPGTTAAYKETGEFPDGAVLVKDIRAIKSKQLTTGNAHWAGETGLWFVMVKDRKSRFPNDPRWAEGWGWALFKADEPAVNITRSWKQGGLSDCYGCHVPVKNTDWVYIDGYPTLRE